MLFKRYSSILTSLILVLLLSACANIEKPPITDDLSTSGNTQAVIDALQLKGYPYVYGGASPEAGFDCSGLVVYVYKQQGVILPRTTHSLAQQLQTVPREQRQPGDLVFFHTDRPFSHVGIYLGEDHFIHAPSSRTGRVMISNLQQDYWRKRFIAVRRPLPTETLSYSVVNSATLSKNFLK